MDPKLLQLPAAVQLALASGYAAYLVAYRGIREHHKTIDTAFLTLVFSLAGTGIAILLRASSWPWIIGLTFAGTVGIGILWRMFGISLIGWILRTSDLSWADDTPSAWASIQANSRYLVSQISVLTDDDTWLDCTDTSPFAALPFGPCTLGTNGDVALYVTHTRKVGGEAKEQLTTLNDDGARLTYVPATKIKRIAIRHRPLILRGWRLWLSNLSGLR